MPEKGQKNVGKDYGKNLMYHKSNLHLDILQHTRTFLKNTASPSEYAIHFSLS